MAKINVPYGDIQTTSTQEGGFTNTGIIGNATDQVLNAGGNLLDVAFKQADSFRSMAYSAELRAFEAEQNASLLKLLPAGMKEIGQAVDSAVEKIARIDQAQFDENLQKEMDAYMLSEGMKFQEEYLYYKQSLKEANGGAGDSDAPKKASSWVNDRIKNIVGSAPSEKAKLRMTEFLMKAKINALEDGFQIRDHALAEARRNKLKGDAVDAAIKAARNTPENALESIDMLTNIGQQLLYNDVPKKEVDPFLKHAEGKIWGATVEGFLDKDQTGKALAVLGSQAKTVMDPDVHSGYVNKIAKAEVMKYITNKKEIKLAIAQSQIERGDALPGAGNIDQASDNLFFDYMATKPNPLSFTSVQDAHMGFLLTNHTYFANKNQVMGKEAAQYLMDMATQRSNPYAALSSAMTLDAIVKDKSGIYGNLSRELLRHDTGNYAQNLQAALTYVRRVSAGEKPEQAYETVQKLLEPVSKEEQEMRKETLKTFYGSGGFVDKLGKDALSAIKYDPWGPTKIEARQGKDFNVDAYLAEYKTVFEENYILSGNTDTAELATNAQMSSVWGTTEVNGRVEVMRGAPTSLYSQPDKAEKELRALSIKAAMEQGGFDVSDSEKQLVTRYVTYADDKTQTVKPMLDDKGNPIIDQTRRVGIAPIYNVTVNSFNGKITDAVREYMVVDLDTGMPIMHKDDPTRVVTVKYGRDIKKYEDKLRAQQESITGPYVKGQATDSTMNKIESSGAFTKADIEYNKLKQSLYEMESKNSD